jgi:acetylornithine deacetylase/succinyl-diaminopimelate desuccinylase-like protein
VDWGEEDIEFIFLVEGEGENGSMGFQDAVRRRKTLSPELFEGVDLILMSNNLWLTDDNPCLTYGTRGNIQLDVHVHGPAADLHAGTAGGVVHEPLQDLTIILASLLNASSSGAANGSAGGSAGGSARSSASGSASGSAGNVGSATASGGESLPFRPVAVPGFYDQVTGERLCYASVLVTCRMRIGCRHG